jgi:hypothetical protein
MLWFWSLMHYYVNHNSAVLAITDLNQLLLVQHPHHNFLMHERGHHDKIQVCGKEKALLKK